MLSETLDHCLASVRQWAEVQKYDYRFIGDEIFERVPQWYLEKVGEKLPVATDYARLELIQEALTREKYTRAIWFDADILIFDQSLMLEWTGSCAFGQEVWIQRHTADRTRLKAKRNVHNAVTAFNRDSATLPFLRETVMSIIRRIEPEFISPQVVGPKLLNALHSIAGFSLLPQVGAFSPEVLQDLAFDGGPALSLMLANSTMPPKAANLGFSVAPAVTMKKAVARLVERGGVWQL